ncbi:FKBP-type peptidyl-prolyl cis-trans isomerase [Fibrella forsythiae]|uniref:Peptidyl-prolyl cis-trans isomerase n=1 Tax=Fibrella forsythiae TaxID=2817061 RepID=A0ABS3JNT9_9BACT|nr:FKBP-type peptidyl-prolyl cis-trans isomerase [Fibrella forsythiae]MBO0951645.1 FKBP-type peptidyl-prolyl cis-trans isomerase [Fibrella forsythiae]
MQIKTLTKATLLAAVMMACGKDRVQTTETGLKYQMHEQNEGARKSKIGDILTLHLALKNAKDSVIRDTHKEGTPLQLMLQVPPFKGSFEEGLAMLGKGDSATFYVKADSLFTRAGQPFPPGITKGSDIVFNVKLLNVQNEQEFQKAQTESRDKQKSIDDKILTDYLAKNGLAGKAQKTANGVYYIINQPGTGVKPNKGDNVQVQYTGKLLNGKVFDSSLTNQQSGGKPVQFQVGVGMIIPGWEEGIMQFAKGTKGTLFIPSGMAYGQQGAPPTIPANSPLIFDIELVDVSKGQPQQMPQMPGQQQGQPQAGGR